MPAYGSHPINNLLPPGGASFIEIDAGTSAPPVVLTPQHIEELAAGRKKLFVLGRVTYRDIFNEVWDYGYVIQFVPVTSIGGQIAWRDVSPSIEHYSFLNKRPDPPNRN
jgi:hypothetical protein